MQSPTISWAMAAALGLTLASSGAIAQTQSSPQSTHVPAVPPASPTPTQPATDHSGLPSFADLDKKHRGYLSRSDIPKNVEGLRPLRAHFMESDTDHNGRLSPNEYAAYVQAQKPDAEKPPAQP